MTYLKTRAGHLRSALRAVAPAVVKWKNNSVPILACVLIEQDKVTAHDLDMQIEANFPIEGASKINVCVDFRQLVSLASGMPKDQSVEIISDEDGVVFRFDSGAYKLASQSPKDFAKFREPQSKARHFICSNWGIKDAFKSVRHAVSDEETRYYLNGVCLTKRGDGTPCIVATDGHRMEVRHVNAMPAFDADAIVSKHIVDTVIGMSGEPQTIDLHETAIRFQYPGVKVSGRLIDGTYPDFERVIPNEDGEGLLLDRQETRAALRRLTCNSQYRSRAVRLTVVSDAVIMSSEETDRDGVEKLFHAEADSGSECPVVGLNGNYLRDAVNRSGDLTAPLHLKIRSGADPIKIEADGSISIIMPLRTGSEKPSTLISHIAEIKSKAA